MDLLLVFLGLFPTWDPYICLCLVPKMSLPALDLDCKMPWPLSQLPIHFVPDKISETGNHKTKKKEKSKKIDNRMYIKAQI